MQIGIRLETPHIWIDKVIKNLSSVFWGLIIIGFDITVFSRPGICGIGTRLDIINDFAGAIILYGGVVGLAKIPNLGAEYKFLMKISCIAAGIQMGISFLDFFTFKGYQFWLLFLSIIDLFTVIGGIAFFRGMMIFSEVKQLVKSSKKWKACRRFYLWIFLVPMACIVFLQLLYLTLSLSGYQFDLSFSRNWGDEIVFLLIIVLINSLVLLSNTFQVTRKELLNLKLQLSSTNAET